jgi:hypothetical protein
MSLRFQLLSHPLGPTLTRSAGTTDGVRQLLHIVARMVISDNAYPVEAAPGAAWIAHLPPHALVIITGMVAVIGGVIAPFPTQTGQ